MTRLFVFGSMRDRELLEVVLGRDLACSCHRPAFLEGWRLGLVPNERYPLLVEDADSTVPGDVLEDLSPEDIDRIRFFEGEEYELNLCTVTIEGVGTEEVLFCDYVRGGETSGSWSFEAWQTTDKAGFLEIARKYMVLYGRGSLEEADALWSELETKDSNRSSAA